MAKLNYNKPLFSICQIPLDAAGTAGGCAIQSRSGDYICPVIDPEYGDEIFQDDDCDVGSLYGEEYGFCFRTLTEDMNIYNS